MSQELLSKLILVQFCEDLLSLCTEFTERAVLNVGSLGDTYSMPVATCSLDRMHP